MDVSVSLPESVADFVKEKVASGRFGSSSEVVSEALRQMQEAERQDAEKLAWLRQAWDKGMASGDAGELDFAELKRAARARLSSGA
jgi:antitoxin ParD1/3/4